MTISDWLIDSMVLLQKAEVHGARKDCLILLADAFEKDKSWVHAHAQEKLTTDQVLMLDAQVARREKREPLAYIRGKQAFYGRDFLVNRSVLIPRPESESFITLLKEIKPRYIDDIGTGSGCLAISAALELPNSQVFAIDNDLRALRVARANAKELGAKVGFVHSDMLRSTTPIGNDKKAIIANFPYVPDGFVVSQEIGYEPKHAIFSGEDGLDHYREFWKQVSELDDKPAYILTEALLDQHLDTEELAEKAGYKLQKTDVLVQLFKHV